MIEGKNGAIASYLDNLAIEQFQQSTKKKIDKINSNNQKITKLQDHVKTEADSSNHKINTLRNFRSMYPNIDSLERFLKNVQIILENA